MGIPKLKGYINKDEQLSFIAHISTTENFEDDFGCSGELDEMIKNLQNPYLKLKRGEGKETRVVFALFFSSLSHFKKNAMVSFYKGISNEESNDFDCICCGDHSRRIFTMEYLKQKERRKVLESTRGTSRKVYSL